MRPLTDRQTQILHMKSRGMKEAQIAKRLGIATSTVRNLRNTAGRNLGVAGRHAAVRRYLETAWKQ